VRLDKRFLKFIRDDVDIAINFHDIENSLKVKSRNPAGISLKLG
jgi:hypothetical protein